MSQLAGSSGTSRRRSTLANNEESTEQPRTTVANTQPPDDNSQPLFDEDQWQQEFEDEFESWTVLTQYIGPPASPKKKPPPRTDSTEQEIRKELETFKSNYLEEIDTLDRAQSHLESLNRATGKGRTPAKLAVTIKPLVINKDDPIFKREWDQAIKSAEKGLLEALTKHLKRIITESNDNIRNRTKLAFANLKKLQQDSASCKLAIEEVLKTAEEERKSKSETRRKRKLEAAAAAEKAAKKPRT